MRCFKSTEPTTSVNISTIRREDTVAGIVRVDPDVASWEPGGVLPTVIASRSFIRAHCDAINGLPDCPQWGRSAFLLRDESPDILSARRRAHNDSQFCRGETTMSQGVFANHAHVFPASMNPAGTIDRLLQLLDACQIAQAICFAPFPHQCDKNGI